MSYLPDDQEEVIILSTRKPLARWLRLAAKAAAVLLALGIIAAGVLGWRYYAAQQRLKQDLTRIIREEEHLRALGGVNALSDILDPRAARSWRFRYHSSVVARKGHPEPAITVEAVAFDGADARVQLQVNGVDQYRHYHLYGSQDWRRTPFVATGWGEKHTRQDVPGFEIIYWDNDSALAQIMAEHLPDLQALMQPLGLTPVTTRWAIIPQEFGDLMHHSRTAEGMVLNSPYVDWIDLPPAGLTPQQVLLAEMGKKIMRDARQETPVQSDLPGAARVQAAIDELLVWHWVAGAPPADILADWAKSLNGRWVSPATGLTPDLLTQLPPEAPDAAARLMMTALLQAQGPDALLRLSAALPQASSWDQAYRQATGMDETTLATAAQSLGP